ncbi:MAG: dipicolinate synthase subunit DpsA [Clostridia bacterium]|nr:dipicolinate synthase subunit DpsA [Clostridia bacterium]
MDISLIGGDARIGMLAETAAHKGNRVLCCGLDMYGFGEGCLLTDSTRVAIRSSKVIILPLPVSRDGINLFAPLSYFGIKLDDITKYLGEEKIVLGGMINKEYQKEMEKTGAKVIDYFEREELNILNAVSTIEGALEIAMHETDTTVFDSDVLVVGYGRLGKVAANRFDAMGAKVTVTARKKSDLAWINVGGYNSINTKDIYKYIGGYNIIINTVPHIVLGEKELSKAEKGTIIIDLASQPGGTDFEFAAKRGIKAIAALSLPGKVAPKSAATVIFDTISGILDEYNLE